ncbi:MAG: hypothetical protein CBC42_04530 [Betaproteobacteria bacterium TMED82]|nr:MAG: hypothetical protein CBC42_04530 [Betaproteobacteria bacterium TMED82]
MLNKHWITIVKFFIFFVSLFFVQNNYAASMDPPTLKYLGSFQFDLNATYFIDDYKMFSDFGPGKITLKDGGSGIVNVCNENTDVIANDKKTIALTVSCEIIMDDGAGLRLQYYGRIVPGKGFYEKVEHGETAKVNDGVDSWFTGVTFRTSSKKYAYLNNELIVGRGTSLTFPKGMRNGSVNYDFYKVTY